jgi:hypothetical protein
MLISLAGPLGMTPCRHHKTTMTRFHRSLERIVPLLIATLAAAVARAAGPASRPAAWEPIGGPTFAGWTDVTVAGDTATLTPGRTAAFRYPQGPLGWHSVGFRLMNDQTRDWRAFLGIQFEVRAEAATVLAIELDTPPTNLRQEFLPALHAACPVTAGGMWRRVTLPWSSFGLNPSQHATLGFIQRLSLSAPAEVQLRDVRLTRAPALDLSADVCGRAVAAGGEARYDVTVTNCTDEPQDVMLAFENVGWQAMTAVVDPPRVSLPAGATANCTVTVHVPTDVVPPGGHETQTLLASAGVAVPARLPLVTARDVDGPSILHTAAEWDAVRANVRQYDWARAGQADIVRDADRWTVPQAAVPPHNWSEAEQHDYTFANPNFPLVQTAAEAWQLTRDKRYAEKVATFLRRLSDEHTGYPATLAGTNMGSPQEGQNFQCVAIAYDAIRDAGVLSDGDRAQIDRTLRLFMENDEPALTVGNVGNWSTAANTADLFCALSMGDLAAAQRHLYGPGGFTDYLSKGIMDDGWWWECSTSYNFWVAAELTQSALACRPWGIDLLNAAVPATYSRDTIITPWALDPPYGISFQKWGPNRRSTRSIKQLWDAVPAAADYRGIAFGMNDGHGERVGGSRLELAYFAYRDPAYATFIKLARQRDVIYGVPELPEDPARPYTRSGYAENLGYALLRSQTPGRPVRDQIQAVLKIGTQGGFHGHFDRVSLDNVTRYGRSFWCPEAIWFGYPNYMYKFYVQTSLTHNMVVVDQKQQEAVPSTQPLFFSGRMMQVAVQETNARWSDPPYGGMVYMPGDTFATQMRKNMQSLPLATDRRYGELGPFTDRVLQRRAAVVTDDYVLIADHLKSAQPHTFDNLFQMKGLVGLDAPDKRPLRHDAQFNPDPHGAGQFITDCDWTAATAPAVGRFSIHFGEGSDQAKDLAKDLNEPGQLNVDVHALWPPQQELMLATPAEESGLAQWVTYAVAVDDKQLAHGETGTWVLGAADVDVPVTGGRQMSLTVSAAGGRRKALFWVNPRFLSADGKELAAPSPADLTNVEQPPTAGQDYYGQPVRVAGVVPTVAWPTQPADGSSPAVVRLAVPAGAASFRATIGGANSSPDPQQPRRVFASRVRGTEASFLTVLEPYEKTPMVKSATATGPDTVRVELADGRVQVVHVQHLDGRPDEIGVTIHETLQGAADRDEHGGHE